ncbi:MAG: DUF1565 domain-containing protein [Planctomycetes bacterium]|nr:DUF1565 domain-containing protein [Planctomycetota bacterium]
MRGMSAVCPLVVMLTLCLAAVAADAAVYVVDNGHPKASDENRGTEAAPWKTIAHAAAEAKPGDTVCVMEGNYDERVTLTASGERGKLITLKALPPHTVHMKGFDARKVSYVRIEGFAIADVEKGIEMGGDGIEIVGNQFLRMTGAAVYTRNPNVKPQGVRVAYNNVYHSQKGFIINGSRWIVENNHVERLFRHSETDCDYSRVFGDDHVVRCNYYHGTSKDEIGKSHVDAIQFFDSNGETSHRVLVCDNVFMDFHQAFMCGSGSSESVSAWVFERNLMIGNWASWGLCLSGGNGKLKAINNTFARIASHGIGARQGADNVLVRNNIFLDIGANYWFEGNQGGVGDHNILSNGRPRYRSPEDLVGVDPKVVDAAKGNFRLTAGSPAIDAGTDGADIGALEYPNVYYVDPRHPGASDEGFGYAGAPFATVAQACAMAAGGETIVLRGGVYRETIRPQADGVTIRAAENEPVTISGADLVTGWKRDGDGWAAPMAECPGTPLLMDGKAENKFAWDEATKTIRIKGLDPRLHVIECVSREHGVDLRDRKDVKVVGIDVVRTSGEGIVK